MRLLLVALLCCCGLGVTMTCHAGGFFRRVPDVGEWARFEHTASFTHQEGKPSERMDEFKGTVLFKCVGEEVIDEQRYLWIEWRRETIDSTGFEMWSVIKVLVPEEGLLAGALTEENVRGWKTFMGSEPEPLDFANSVPRGADWEEVSQFLGPDPTASAGRMDDRTLVVNDVEVQLTYAETASLPSQEDGDSVRTGEVTWWPDEDLAFGIASVHQILRTEYDELGLESHGLLTYDLVATGTDAVSELPDHN